MKLILFFIYLFNCRRCSKEKLRRDHWGMDWRETDNMAVDPSSTSGRTDSKLVLGPSGSECQLMVTVDYSLLFLPLCNAFLPYFILSFPFLAFCVRVYHQVPYSIIHRWNNLYGSSSNVSWFVCTLPPPPSIALASLLLLFFFFFPLIIDCKIDSLCAVYLNLY